MFAVWLYAFQIQNKELEANLKRKYVKWLKAQIQRRSSWMGLNIGSNTHCVALDKIPNFSMPQFPHL